MNLRQGMLSTAAVASLLAACREPKPEADQQSSWAEAGGAGAGNGIGHVARVMSRNVYLGADLTPAIGAPDLGSLVSASGAILRQVTATNFPMRAKGLAAEILEKQPDLVGLQEVALWRVGPPSIAPLLGAPKTATTVRYDYLDLLLNELNAGELRYRLRRRYRAAVRPAGISRPVECRVCRAQHRRSAELLRGFVVRPDDRQ